jgi:hypothetical protein
LLAIFALLPIGLTTNRNSVNSTVAASLASGIVADLRSVPHSIAGTEVSPLYHLNPATNGELSPTLYLKTDGSSTPNASTADYRVKIVLFQPKTPGVPEATKVYIQISWPAAAPNPSESFEVVTAIDRN